MVSEKYLGKNASQLAGSVQVLALPYAAGSLRSYDSLKKVEGIELVKYEAPGRGFRHTQPFSDMSSVIAEVIEAIDFARPYILFGHSMGAYITYELCAYIEQEKLQRPQKVILSAQLPPSIKRKSDLWKSLTRKEATQYFKNLGGTLEEVLANQELMDLYTEVLNQDFTFLRTYFKNGWTEKVKSDLEIWYGEDDGFVNKETITIWDNHTLGKCKFVCFKGNHFFIHQLLAQPDLMKKLLLDH
ncbi:thioesterase II family protein [Paenibacillus sp. OK003]|uniref:thioesterase II family protein n=1 Tax=Paenibacillus sp. OK003 TaxID=1884380 RepID=UPI0008C55A72|nr:alpha/beta fold hydrolase [Paenibacillus sp. OK003]SEL32619.1 Surfactin synthase thioesterase subunit [Paenibacillus sp. OK003]